ncbi:MAG: DEAD/DEAH box helicase family protein [Ruminococcus sp.]|nr:DEAD/DEAH box helicase family protein [Ruminococcus sp.]
MAISLFPHNQTAYEAALKMLQNTGKAAVIHPTGTGKSFIGFQLCEEFPEANICWLSPSEYIFQTQLENLAATGAEKPKNIRFFTYAKLMLMSEEEMAEIHPAYIILDEFHRCGAKAWGQGVERLRNVYSKVPILGLSATAIRYLDNQRDMSDELFDGNIASEMTLGEAVVRGILHPPKYVLSVFSYQKDLEKYEKRVRTSKNKVVRDLAEKQLETLRRALEQADGLEEIFRKHMTDRAGKYIVFCANYPHMQEMMEKAPEWFAKVDRHPHLYSAYSDAPETEQAFAEFKSDQSEHLKLLYCIDMLNEGIHVEDVSGVILLRPTVSPIIYKQQIGRALSAGKKKDAVIFDIVLNIENLYSISAVEEEMRVALSYYRFQGQEEKIVNEHFQVIDEVRDSIALFTRLQETLTASWDLMYACAKQYHAVYGNLEVPLKYKTEDGYSLGSWLFTQRKVYAGEQYGVLGEERIRKLNALGMVWGSYRDLSWERYFDEARKYWETHGNLNVSAQEVTDSGARLGAWICRLRTYRKSGIQKGYLTEERIHVLNELGMIWDVPDYLWEENFMECMQYYRTFGNLEVPGDYCSPGGLKIGKWLRRQRLIREGKAAGELTPEQIARLDTIGMVWKNKQRRQWEKGLEEATVYYKEYGNLDVPTKYISATGFRLGGWISDRRERGREKHSLERQKQLDAIGMIWERPDPWERRYALAKAYYEEYGNLRVPSKYRADGIWLAKWLNEQKQIYAGKRPGKKLREEQIQRLDAIGMVWQKEEKCLYNRAKLA